MIKHDLGQSEICSQPQRVIALGSYELDLLLSLNIEPVGYAEDNRALVGSPQLGKTVVGIKYLGDRITTLPTHVGTWQTPSIESILKLNPDLILSRGLDQNLYEHLSKIAPVILPNLDSSPTQWQEDILTLGQVTGQETQAQSVISAYRQNIAVTGHQFKASKGRQTILLLAMNDLDAIEVFAETTFAGNLLTDLGFQLIVPQNLIKSDGSVAISLESLPQLDSDIIVIMASGNSSVAQVKALWQQSPILRALRTSQAKRVYFVDYQLWSRTTGPIAAELIIDELRELLL
ncbi:MAG: iron-siderophore ABC transporter substrate-binding protein [Acaryochloridaceae cyanobacterium CSU_3_4]|nr:iron-siderophore ABC transporter substrate-binding protein [Acaryochloridaceae cyanobacterium CSU_3_4]